ncbi:hypothetical protein TorRG33x02_189550 [Trema orientale]|uniref:Uncharacterized protein n=1 Tax=Trema orientale TaxID=63057 RepID=A0A2P5EIC2_TREOI|nr:hypothetical protein TorRG33x02_189550 [Trema orientale]
MELIVITSIDSRASKHVQGGCQLMSFRRHREEEERRRDEIEDKKKGYGRDHLSHILFSLCLFQ